MRWKKPIIQSAQNNISHEDMPITFLMSRSDNDYISSLAAAVQASAEKAGYKIKILDSKNSAILQLEQVKSANRNGEKAIIINLVDPYDAPNLLEAAGDMKVIFLNRIPTDMSILNKNAIYVGSDNAIAGKLQGEFLVNYFKAINQDNIKYLLLEGTPGLPTTVMRTDSALKALSDGGINATAAALPIVADFEHDEALYKIFPLLISGIKFDTIISNNDDMALGAIDAMEALNMDPSKTPIVGIDATFPAFQALREGSLAMTVFQDAVAQASVAIAAMTNMLNGEPIDKGTGYTVSADNPYSIYIPFEPVTINNIPSNLEYPIQ